MAACCGDEYDSCIYKDKKTVCLQCRIAQRIPVEFVLLWVPCDWAGSVMQERGASVVSKPIKICFQKTKYLKTKTRVCCWSGLIK